MLYVILTESGVYEQLCGVCFLYLLSLLLLLLSFSSFLISGSREKNVSSQCTTYAHFNPSICLFCF